MSHPSKHRLALLETLEGRSLFSASVNQILSDVGNLASASTTVEIQANQTANAIQLDDPAGTKGKGPLVKAVALFDNDLSSITSTLSTDINTIQGDANNPTALSGAIATLSADDVAARATLKKDFLAVEAILAKHPVLLTSSSVVSGDITTLISDWSAFKVDYKLVKADLA